MPSPLPIDEVLPGLIAALREKSAAVLIAPTGAGKTTRVPPALLAAGIAAGQRIVMLEPRRIAARAAARRMAEEGGWTLGREVGYQVRFERRAGPETQILVVTEGILVQRLQADPFLEDVGTVIFDEIHERNLQTDLSLAMARRVQREVRPDLRLLAMSATLDPGPLAAFLGDCPTIESRGRLHPVEILYGERPDDRALPAQVAAGVRRMLAATPGDVLVFLPGVGEIQRCAEALAAERDLAVLPLYGDLPAERQDEVLRPLDRRKVVLATNVAETSITIDGVTAVVDSGLVRRLRFDPATGLDRLELGKVSRASADQRAGRAGRQAPGVCLRLWPAWEQPALPERETPEIARVDLAGPALQLTSWGESDLEAFDWFEAPDPAALDAAVLLLRQLGALDDRGVTALGRTLARLPVHPRLGRLLAEGQRLGHPREAALLAALLSERDPFLRPLRGAGPRRASRSDLLDRLDALEAFERRQASPGELNAGAARLVLRARDQLAELVKGEAGKGSDRDDALLRALLAAYPDRVARRREPRSPRGVMVGGRGVRLADESAVLEAPLFLCVDLDAGRSGPLSEALVRKASEVEPGWLPPERLRTPPRPRGRSPRPLPRGSAAHWRWTIRRWPPSWRGFAAWRAGCPSWDSPASARTRSGPSSLPWRPAASPSPSSAGRRCSTSSRGHSPGSSSKPCAGRPPSGWPCRVAARSASTTSPASRRCSPPASRRCSASPRPPAWPRAGSPCSSTSWPPTAGPSR
jgi:ATP-dependent helicase HrpB